MVPFWGRCTTHFSLLWWPLGCSLFDHVLCALPVLKLDAQHQPFCSTVPQVPKRVSKVREPEEESSEISQARVGQLEFGALALAL